jgi:hypothetical protein
MSAEKNWLFFYSSSHIPHSNGIFILRKKEERKEERKQFS